MSATLIAEFAADRFDHIIEDMLAVELGEVDAQYAVELAETVHAVNVARHAEGRDPVALPLGIQGQVIQCAKRGMLKGRGKGRPRDSHVIELLKDAIACDAKDRQRVLHAQGMKKSAAQAQALEEARVAHARYGLSFSTTTIKRRMQNSDI